MKEVKVIVCGGRRYTDVAFVEASLDALEKHLGAELWVAEGGATGADALAHDWAKQRLRRTTQYCAQWDKHGRSAGPKRNAAMLIWHKPKIVVAFPGGRGTAHMMSIARKAGVQVWEPAKGDWKEES